ncbi:protein-lysine N-methyltransferase EEF2KMT isoform X2 [Telopea speciosissima]|uniref:protein-lysine N-methyltransferase EEF2KMT isoform X2 n=1 Tax=Telopea speciosissima TaxID=54955 RepID=UPI001CC5FFA2|nr:protein-lysine N-methyltransferase EEF2KMT isoform X2 [Telopea speciosissima]
MDEDFNPSTTACLHLVSAFLAMEPTDCLISLARECGGGSITMEVQSFIWEECINRAACNINRPSDSYIKNFLKKVIVDVESNCSDVLDGLYEQYAYYLTALKDDSSMIANKRVCKSISFLFPDGPSRPTSKLVVPLRCSLDMLEGDTGCSIWPSSLFLSEFILSHLELFSNKSCFEVGSGVGLVGVILAYVKAKKVVLSDGDFSSLANLKLNLEMNQLITGTDMPDRTLQDPNLMECIHLSWESASESRLRAFRPDIVLGADVIYDPICVPHLIRVLAIFLNPDKSNPCQRRGAPDDNDLAFGSCLGRTVYGDASNTKSQFDTSKKGTVAYIATVIRNLDTFHCFLKLSSENHLSVVDITETQKPLELLPYMQSYNRSSIRLFSISFSGDQNSGMVAG